MQSSATQAATFFAQLDQLKANFQQRIAESQAVSQKWTQIQQAAESCLAQHDRKIKLSIGGASFSSSKSTLLRFPLTVFSVMLSTSHWKPHDSVFFFDVNPYGFDHVLDYLSEGSIRLSILDAREIKALKSHLDFFQVPYVADSAKKLIREPQNSAEEIVAQSSQSGQPGQTAISSIEFLYKKKADGGLAFTAGPAFGSNHPQRRVLLQSMDVVNNILQLDSTVDREMEMLNYKLSRWRQIEQKILELAEVANEQIRLEFRGRFFTTCKKTLMKTSWFGAQVSRWKPDEETGAYFIDRNPRFIDYILDYLRTGTWDLEGMDLKYAPELLNELDYFCIGSKSISKELRYKEKTRNSSSSSPSSSSDSESEAYSRSSGVAQKRAKSANKALPPRTARGSPFYSKPTYYTSSSEESSDDSS